MKGTIKLTLKGQSVIKVIVIYFTLFGNTIFAQELSNKFISKDEYEIINTFFNIKDSKTIYLYNLTYSDKGWSNYFSMKNIQIIFDKGGIPTTISDLELKNIFTKNILSEIYDKIYSSKPIKLNRKKLLNKNIKLTKSFDKKLDLDKGVIRICKPIIINNLAIFRKIGFNEAPIYILKKEKKKWKIVYTFYDWIIFE